MPVNTNAARLNPCLKEQEMSFKCLSDNGYEQDKCSQFFDNYNVCKKFWSKVYNDRRAKGIQPYLPELEDREKIKQDYINSVYGK